MLHASEAMARIERSVRQYLEHTITRGEALEDVIDTLAASGRLLDDDEATPLLPEARSWAPGGRPALQA